jgi:hypothetical protein
MGVGDTFSGPLLTFNVFSAQAKVSLYQFLLSPFAAGRMDIGFLSLNAYTGTMFYLFTQNATINNVTN